MDIIQRPRSIAGLAVTLLATTLLAACAPPGLTRAEGDALKAEVAALRERVGKLEADSAPAAPAAPKVVSLPDATDPARRLGRIDAPVVIVEFTDLQCPYCKRFHAQILPVLQREYIDTGKVRFESRDFPLDFHAQALNAAVLARCAADAGRFWPFREAVFAQQANLAADGLGAAITAAGLPADFRAKCDATGQQRANLVAAEATLGRSIGVRGTPSFLIGKVVNGRIEGTLLVGAGLPEAFRKRIDALLAK
jgi:protein-disulfide isomerase